MLCVVSRTWRSRSTSHLEDTLHPRGELLELAFDIVRDVRFSTSETATKQAYLLLLIQVPTLLPRQGSGRYARPEEFSAIVITQLRPQGASRSLRHAAMLIKA